MAVNRSFKNIHSFLLDLAIVNASTVIFARSTLLLTLSFILVIVCYTVIFWMSFVKFHSVLY